MALKYSTEWKSAWRYAYNVYDGKSHLGLVYLDHDRHWHTLPQLVDVNEYRMSFGTRREAGEALAAAVPR